ncbi:helix-turn-helix domain-containing protein [Paractinoplanes tereljensis]|uniref:helix-turn-helix domain-containing protein n=1 Tax=Paractinoplanes tereljensis TaxID=571912 RepID=UPI001EF16639|nr:helix-turn-helix transcriptional regulator [Actinoplanes tereljensis]
MHCSAHSARVPRHRQGRTRHFAHLRSGVGGASTGYLEGTPACWQWPALHIAGPIVGETYLAFELGRSVRELRERRGWSQTQLAKASGMTQSTVARFEAGGTVPTLSVLERLATALDVRLRVGFEAA